ncbi:hypothetical protein GOV03_01260 [Candidatus Woesearchaeota archaeon]|nr:hypothetical protein [Candidatus Woesearchaeota archaeon]
MLLTYRKEVEEMINLLRNASNREILPRWGKVNAKQKGDKKGFKDIVTEADTEASKYILDKIRSKFPGSYSEEHKFSDRFQHDLIWQIDPVDGTDEFCEQIADGYACHAALLQKLEDNTFFPVAGIIYLPGVDKLWYNDGSDEVVFVNGGRRVAIPRITRNELNGYVRQVDQDKKLISFYRELGKSLKLKTKVLRRGGAGASISDLLEGKINLIVMNYNYTKEWDLAMAEPIIKARGGFICDLEGNKFTYNRQNSPGKDEPYNLNGYVISIVFKKDEIIPHIPKDLLVDRL